MSAVFIISDKKTMARGTKIKSPSSSQVLLSQAPFTKHVPLSPFQLQASSEQQKHIGVWPYLQ